MCWRGFWYAWVSCASVMLTRSWSALGVVLVASRAGVTSDASGSTSPALTTTLTVGGLNSRGRGRSSCRGDDESGGLHCDDVVKVSKEGEK